METSSTVNAAITQSLELSDWLTQNHPPTVVDIGNNKLASALFSIALDHREAVLCLLHHGARSAAFALARSVFEAYVRGSWADLCATEEDHKRAFSRGITPSVDTMVRKLNKIKDTSGQFSKAQILAWEPLSDFAHGGMRQVVRWIGANGVAPQHTDQEILELLTLIDSFGLMASAGATKVAGGSLEPFLSKMKELHTLSKARKASWRAN